MLKPSKYGAGVFATHNIKVGTRLRLFGDEYSRYMDFEDVPEVFRKYCIERKQVIICPVDFGSMPVGWYLNHSDTPNASISSDPDNIYEWYAARDITINEEILIDYNAFDEPHEAKEDYYK